MIGDKLLALWINRLLQDHFKKQKNESTEKLFIKISGISNSRVETILEVLKSKVSSLSDYYDPIIRTVSPIEGFEEFSYKEFETSTWLRNNTKYNQALILIINEITPEAQSLENLFTIDEAYLLSQSGLKSLYNLLSENGYIAPDEIDYIEKFMDLFKSVSEPQLRSVILFFEEIINDPNPSVITRIQRNLPYLNFFMDSKLKISIDDKPRLTRNFQLSNFNISENDQEKIQNNLYSFIEEEENNNFSDEIWEIKSVQEFTNDVIDFLNQKSNSLLFYDFDFVNKVFGFQIKAPTIIEQIKDIYQINKQKFTEEEIKSFEIGIDEVTTNNNPDGIQEFIDEFEETLNTKSGLVKKLDRIVDKLRNPSEYEDLSQALLREIFIFIEEQQGNKDINDSKFELEIVTSKTNENIAELLNLFLKNFQIVSNRIFFIEDSLPLIDDSIKDTDVVFELRHLINGNVLGNKKFKITSFNQLEIFPFFRKIREGIIPYTRNYASSEIVQVDILKTVEESVKHYIISNEEGVKENFYKFQSFLNSYIKKLEYATAFGIFSLDSNLLEKEITEVLKNIYCSTLVSNHIYQYVNLIGAIDYFDSKKDEAGIPVIRKLTVLNPIRLISYIRRFEVIGQQINQWISFAAQELLEVNKIEDYLEYIRSHTKNLEPRYFSSNGDPSFLIENYECLGEGTFVLNTKPSINSDYLVNELSEELIKTTKNYFDVYPYAVDGMDILFLFCQSSEVVKKCVESLFSKTKIKKLRLTVHSENSAKIHNQINKWLEQKEEFTKSASGRRFPALELNVISGRSVTEIFSQVDKQIIDADLVVLADYFGNQINYSLERIKQKSTNLWFETIYKEPLKNDEAVKRISYVSEYLPEILQNFYQMQYIIQSSAMPMKDELYVLKNVISITNISHSSLIDYMHKKFNWSMFLDRYLDKTLLIKTSSQANIIQYKPKAGKNNQFKLIVSSSKYIRKLSENASDYDYYDRLHRKLVSILKNENISRDVVIDSVNKVKEISGALVLKSIGRGKYAHELLATYLSTKKRMFKDQNILQICATCDELPWFANNRRRPDLVLTTIDREEKDRLIINFELVELKFVNHNIFEKERFDALKQIKTGLNLYNRLFSFNMNQLDTGFWRNELIQYFIERSAYSPEHVNLLKELQHIDAQKIIVNINGSVDVYCYTSNLTEYNFEKINDGVYVDSLDSNVKNYIFSRAFILNELKAIEDIAPNYDELIDEETLQSSIRIIEEKTNGKSVEITKPSESSQKQGHRLKTTQPDEPESVNISHLENESQNKISRYPEIEALIDLEIEYNKNSSNVEQIRDQYIRKLKNNFNQNGIHLNIKEAIIGSSVIRCVLDLPADLPVNKVLSRSKDIQLWLGLSFEPHIFINKGMNVDIIRDEPETIYFEKFMDLTRKQLGGKITNTNLIAPLGLDPLNNVIYLDFSNSLSPHLLIGGTTGSGKSVTLNSIILGIMCVYSPEQVQFLFIDPKKVEFTIYEDKKHTRDVITEIEEGVSVLQTIVNEMEERYTKFAREGVTNIEEYILEVGERLPRIVIVFDEFADFMTQDTEMKKQVENAILRLGQKARAAGIHLIICTQNPKADIINTNIRNNLAARLALRASDSIASTIVLDESGAEKLGGKGDFLAKISGRIERGKSPFLTTKVRRALLKYFEKSKLKV